MSNSGPLSCNALFVKLCHHCVSESHCCSISGGGGRSLAGNCGGRGSRQQGGVKGDGSLLFVRGEESPLFIELFFFLNMFLWMICYDFF